MGTAVSGSIRGGSQGSWLGRCLRRRDPQTFSPCPVADAQDIARHACQKHSGRVGRSAAARRFDPVAVRLAVIAHIRHTRTSYDNLLARHGDRQLARSEVELKIKKVLYKWAGGKPS